MFSESVWGSDVGSGNSCKPCSLRNPTAIAAVMALHQLGKDTATIAEVTGVGEDSQLLITSGRLEKAKQIKSALKKVRVIV